jgi:hypothetical protein
MATVTNVKENIRKFCILKIHMRIRMCQTHLTIAKLLKKPSIRIKSSTVHYIFVIYFAFKPNLETFSINLYLINISIKSI